MFDVNVELFGLDEVLKDLELIPEQIDEGMEEIAKEVANEILNNSIANVSGPDTRKSIEGGQPYPVGVQTGNLKRSLKVKKLSNGKWKVFADLSIARYSWWVHEGSKKMEARPFLDDAKDYVIASGKYLDIANKILDDILNR